MIIPVIKQVEEHSEYSYTVLALTTAGKDMEAAGIPYKSFCDYPLSPEAEAHGARLEEAINGGNSVPRAETIAYLGNSFNDLANKIGEAEASSEYKKHGRRAFLPTSFLKKVILEEECDLVVATNSPRAEQAAILAAQELSIPSVCVVDLGFSNKQIPWIAKRGFADRVCVLSEKIKSNLVNAGRCSERIVVTGNPAFDELIDYQGNEARQQLRKARGWEEKDIALVWLSSPEPRQSHFDGARGDVELPRKIEQELCEIAQGNVVDHVIFRRHPNESFDDEPLPPSVEISQPNEEIGEVLAAADCVVVTSSTAGLQAAILKKPMVSITSSVTYEYGPKYDELGLAVGVSSIKDIGHAVQQSLSAGAPAALDIPTGGALNVYNVIESLIGSAK